MASCKQSENVAAFWQHRIRGSLCERGFYFISFHATSFEETCLQKQLARESLYRFQNTIPKASQDLGLIQQPQGDMRLSEQQSTLTHVRVQGAALSLLGNLLLSPSHARNIFKPLQLKGILVRLLQAPGKISLCFGFDTLFILSVNASRVLRCGMIKVGKCWCVS